MLLLEQGRRTRAKGDASRQLIEKLDEMAERMQAAPGWREPTPEESAENEAWLDSWLKSWRCANFVAGLVDS